MTTHGPWKGQYTDGLTATVRDVLVTLDVMGLKMQNALTGDVVGIWSLANVTIDRATAGFVRVQSNARRDEAVMVFDASFRHALATQGAIPKTLHTGKLMAVLVVLVIAVVATVVIAIDPLSKFIARQVPMSVEYKIKDTIAKRMADETCWTPTSLVALDELKTRLAGTNSPIDFEIHVTRDKQVNAFALPGGVIFLTQGLIERAESPDEIAGVLAHEMEHVKQRHIMASLVRGLMLTGVWQVAVGDFTGILALDPSTIYHLTTLKYDRDAEAEADAGGLQTIDRAGIAREGYAQFFEHLKKDGDVGARVPDILSTHPDHDRRLTMIHASAGANNPTPALSRDQWRALKESCSK